MSIARSVKKNEDKVENYRGKEWIPIGNWFPVKIRLLEKKSQQIIPRCYQTARHKGGRTLRVRDVVAVMVKYETNVKEEYAKILNIYKDTKTKKLMLNICWYYDVESIKTVAKEQLVNIDERELFASKHVDNIPIATVGDPVFILKYAEYNRYVTLTKIWALPKHLRPNSEMHRWHFATNENHRQNTLPPRGTSMDRVFFCRREYGYASRRILKGSGRRRTTHTYSHNQ